MQGVASLLDLHASARVEEFWQQLELDCGLVGIQVTPFPHFSWQVGEAYDPDRTNACLEELASQTTPFVIRTTGLGIFTGPSPILYLPIVKTDRLIRLHELLWERTRPLIRNSSPLYSPEAWMPHITLAHGDVDLDRLRCALSSLTAGTNAWEIQIDNLVLIALHESREAEVHRYPFGGS